MEPTVLAAAVSIDGLAWGLFAGMLAAAACHDIRTYTIPNRLPAALLLLWLPLALLGFAAPAGIVLATLSLLLGAAAFARGWLGGGDVKLFAAAALWTDFSTFPAFLTVTALAGGLIGAGLLATHRLAGGPAAAPRIPYAVAIAAGGLWLAAGRLAGIG